MSLRHWLHRLIWGREIDHPLSEEEQHEGPPEGGFLEEGGRLEEEFVGDDFDPDEPRSGRL